MVVSKACLKNTDLFFRKKVTTLEYPYLAVKLILYPCSRDGVMQFEFWAFRDAYIKLLV